MNFITRAAKKSPRLFAFALFIAMVSTFALASRRGIPKAFALGFGETPQAESTGRLKKTELLKEFVKADVFVTPGTCDLGGNIEVEATGGVNAGYATLGAAFTAINAGTHTGVITIDVCGNTAEGAAAATLNASGSGSASYTSIKVSPAGAPRTITGANASTLIKLNGADGVTIDGSTVGSFDGNVVGGDPSLRQLTITNTGAGAIVWIGTDATSGANNNTIKNCILVGAGSFTGQGVIAGSGTTFGGAAESGRPNSNITIQNNRISRVQNAVFTSGDATTRDQNWSITENDAGSTTVADKLTFRGILISGADNFSISQNRISGVNSSNTTSSTMSGILVAGVVNGGSITRNEIKDIRHNNTTGWGSNGIYLFASSTASNLLIANNMISDVVSQGFNGNEPADNGYGIAVEGVGGGYNIYNNTVVMNGNEVTAGITAALLIDDTAATAGTVNLRNNILVNTQTVGTNYSVYVDVPVNVSVFSAIDYNDYFSTEHVGSLGGTIRTTLANWQTATGQDANSKSVDPVFVSATNFHLQASSTLLGMGTPIASVTNDFDGQTRDAIPDIGADEIAAPSPGTVQFASATYSVGEGGGSVALSVTRTGGSSGAISVGYSFLAFGPNAASGGASCGAGIDFAAVSGTLNWADGDSAAKTINVTICEDALFEGNETFNSQLQTPTGGAVIGAQNSTLVTITENDADTIAPVITFTPIPVNTLNPMLNATITDAVGVTGATIFWRINGGAYTPAGCSLSGGTAQSGTWSCQITGMSNPNAVSYYVTATDAAMNTAANPTGGAAAPNLFTFGSGAVPAGTYTNMSIGNGVSLGGNVVVNGSLTINGVINTGANTLTLECNAAVTGGGEGSYIIGNLEKRFCGASTFTYPVGAAFALPPVAEENTLADPEGIVSNYSPLTVTITGGTVGSSLTVSVTDAFMDGAVQVNSISRFWTLTENGNLTANLAFTYRNEDVVGTETSYKVIKRAGGMTADYPGGTVNAATNTATAPGVSDFSQWSVGTAVPTAANAEISGRLTTASGEGIRNATVMLSGGDLSGPIYVQTGTFGNYRFSDLPVGRIYIITLISKRYTFADPSRVINLTDSVTDENFVAELQ